MRPRPTQCFPVFSATIALGLQGSFFYNLPPFQPITFPRLSTHSAVSHHIQFPWSLLALACGTVVTAGCSPEVHRYIRFPDLFHPGPAAHQRAEAVEHDPFPENDIGPEVVGGRPLGYQNGVLEAERMTMNAAPPPGVAPTIVPGQRIRVAPTFTPAPAPALPAPAPPFAVPPPVTPAPPVITTPYPPAASAQSLPFIQQQRSPY
jgi:hypothetical protein